jgi:hypothetical protein
MVVRKGLYTLVYFCFIASGALPAIQYEPWIGDQFEFEWRNAPVYQSYPSVAVGSRLVDRSSDDLFFQTSVSNAVAPYFSVDAEFVAAYTREQRPGADRLSLAGRYVFLDDVAGDFATVTMGAVFNRAFPRSLKDISSFHHGINEVELFISAGRETSLSEEDWMGRWWGCLGSGIAIHRGAPWLRGHIAYDWRMGRFDELGVFASGLLGLGTKNLRLNDFNGYGSIRHESLDFGLRYNREIEYFGSLNVEYSYRVYARNFPIRAHRILLSLLYTFGL